MARLCVIVIIIWNLLHSRFAFGMHIGKGTNAYASSQIGRTAYDAYIEQFNLKECSYIFAVLDIPASSLFSVGIGEGVGETGQSHEI